ncbi:hypothetical protein NDU88_006358 [Pleurodeles waltl]|uniref:Uncharacterized protein n=1 Tax=Pleurodeles waltl TaxID=8319 RepID=A0AAV7LWP6_PLEWA|nr:hypothetical protein NDU88_006358 [Pleurodeles waltl]
MWWRPAEASWAAQPLDCGGPWSLVAGGPPVQRSAWALCSADVRARPGPSDVGPCWEGLVAVIAGQIAPGGGARGRLLAHFWALLVD